MFEYFDKTYHDKFTALAYKTLLSVSFWCMLRAGECTYRNNKSTPLLNAHASYLFKNNRHVLKLSIHHPKTAKLSTQVTMALCQCNKYPLLCPYHLLYDYQVQKSKIAPNNMKPEHFLFIIKQPKYKKFNGFGAITYDLWLDNIKSAAAYAGIDPALVGTHCARISGASYFFRNGYAPYLIKYIGRWRSDCWERYIRFDPFNLLFIGDANGNVASYEPYPMQILYITNKRFLWHDMHSQLNKPQVLNKRPKPNKKPLKHKNNNKNIQIIYNYTTINDD